LIFSIAANALAPSVIIPLLSIFQLKNQKIRISSLIKVLFSSSDFAKSIAPLFPILFAPNGRWVTLVFTFNAFAIFFAPSGPSSLFPLNLHGE